MAYLFDIKRFALNDGPGIRTTLFLKGCPLHCIWCHNPEGIQSEPEKLYTRKKCIGCQTCVEVCPKHLPQLTSEGITFAEGCEACGLCTEACPTLALEMAGREWTMDELMAVVEKERQVMEESQGGVTLCGGEPLLHPEFAIELLTALGNRGFHRTVDTTLFVSEQTLQRVMPLCELFMIDLKHMDSALHQRFTGVPNEQILKNIRLVSEAAHPFWIRIPLIVGVNADKENLEASAKFIASLPNAPEVVNLLIYHDIGKGKHARMGTTYNPEEIMMQAPSQEQQQEALDIFKAYGINVKIGG